MTISTEQDAALAADAYQTYPNDGRKHSINVDGIDFDVVAQRSDPNGYQGTLYRRADTGELVVAHRGTEFDRELVKDGLIADGGMVFVGANSQADSAKRFTEQALEQARALNLAEGKEISVTVTGHSLGGTLAQITAYEYGLKGETFDAYGAAGLTRHIPEGGQDVINHMRATDFVSAASRHYGEVRTYATEQDIAALKGHGYANDHRVLTDLRNPFGVAVGVGVAAHYSSNFLPTNPEGGGSIINTEDAARYAEYRPMIDKYRNDIHLVHQGLALPRNVVHGMADALGHGREARHRQVGGEVEPVSVPLPGHADLRLDPMFQQIQGHVARLDASLGRTPDAASERMSASLYAKAVESGMTRVDGVHLSIEGAQSRAGERVFAVQGNPADPAHLRTSVSTQEAVQAPVEQSFSQAEQSRTMQQQAAAQSRQAPQQHESMGALGR
ncbi:XVIPCD domain-containing protein [Pseudoxanthomonas sp. UC19_8]|uniref:XVIPCD domain-containing protein n=1 Tax=Pseudoxanthomonas sp. UC19_8 TaxID=3350175 RepID=UPI0036D2C179